jgi:hypothetical protein
MGPAVITAAAVVATEATGAVIVSKATESLINSIGLAFSDRSDMPKEIQRKIDEVTNGCRVLSSGASPKLESYARSPILDHMKKRLQDAGTVYVAYVPPGMGKTTACHACMKKRYPSKGIAFCPSDRPFSYFHAMVHLLGFDPNKPPVGLLQLLIDSLSKGESPNDPEPSSKKHPFLILDDFMTGGVNEADLTLLSSIKTAIRETPLIVLVMTANKTAANYMLSQNGLMYVQPLVTVPAIVEIREKFGIVEPGTSVPLDWEKYVRMKWEKSELKKTVLRHFADDNSRFDEVYNSVPDDRLEALGPRAMLHCLKTDRASSLAECTTMSSTESDAVQVQKHGNVT